MSAVAFFLHWQSTKQTTTIDLWDSQFSKLIYPENHPKFLAIKQPRRGQNHRPKQKKTPSERRNLLRIFLDVSTASFCQLGPLWLIRWRSRDSVNKKKIFSRVGSILLKRVQRLYISAGAKNKLSALFVESALVGWFLKCGNQNRLFLQILSIRSDRSAVMFPRLVSRSRFGVPFSSFPCSLKCDRCHATYFVWLNIW